MDKNRIKGGANQVSGSVKKAIGKAVGNKRLEVDGEVDIAKGKVQSAIGGLKDAVRKIE